MDDLIQKYDPKNSGALTQEDIDAMQNLTDDEIRQLANAFPNTGFAQNYLVLRDLNKKDGVNQVFPTSTWATFYNIRVKNKLKNYVAYTFKNLFIRPRMPIPVSGVIQDLTEQEIKAAPGIRRTTFTPVSQGGVKETINVDIGDFPDLAPSELQAQKIRRARKPLKTAKKKTK